jgi:hypothetical protein
MSEEKSMECRCRGCGNKIVPVLGFQWRFAKPLSMGKGGKTLLKQQFNGGMWPMFYVGVLNKA